jgi:iron only hydrogenase large subunit-like protein
MLTRVRAFATQTLGFAHVFDTTFAREIALREHAREFFERKERAATSSGGSGGSDGPLPMLSSACPGWVCYAEKTHGEMLPFIAATKSPQQVMGTLVKEWLGPHYWNKQYAPLCFGCSSLIELEHAPFRVYIAQTRYIMSQ